MKKIVVYFGSFNPLTNAHVAVMKSAVAHIGADQGYFVATSDAYLHHKAIRTGNNFILTEEERKYTIEEVCKNEPKLSFWGFELGGVAPKRYGTICKIKEQNKDAEVYELQGADKLLSDTKFKNAADYISNTKFIIIDRGDIDVKLTIESDPLLKQYAASFILLPAVNKFSNVSSTEVRRRFYAGIDYADLIPASSVAVLKKHTPANFTLTFDEKIKNIIRYGGKFGDNTACTAIYKENTRIFADWKNGISNGIDFGDYTQFLDDTKIYKAPYDVNNIDTRYPHTITGCINIDCVDLADELIKRGYKPAILNLASAHRPAGGYDRGSRAQEESLCRSSNLSLSLYQYGNPKKMKCIRDSQVPTKTIEYPLDLNYGGVYTPNVTFFRHGRTPNCYATRNNPFKCDVITVAALSFNDNHQYSDDSEHCFKDDNGSFTDAGNQVMLNKIRTIFRMGVEHGRDSLILGAFGCGVYELPVNEVVKQFRTVMEEPEFKNKFKLILFAILEPKKKPSGVNGKYADFYKEFGNYSLD